MALHRSKSIFIVAAPLRDLKTEIARNLPALECDIVELWSTHTDSSISCDFMAVSAQFNDQHHMHTESYPVQVFSSKRSRTIVNLANSDAKGYYWDSFPNVILRAKAFGAYPDRERGAPYTHPIESATQHAFTFRLYDASETHTFYLVGYAVLQPSVFSDQKLGILQQMATAFREKMDVHMAEKSAQSTEETAGMEEILLEIDEKQKNVPNHMNKIVERDVAPRPLGLQNIGRSKVSTVQSLQELTKSLSVSNDDNNNGSNNNNSSNSNIKSKKQYGLKQDQAMVAAEQDGAYTFHFPYEELPVNILEDSGLPVPCDLSMQVLSNVSHLADGSNANVFLGTYLDKQVLIKAIKPELMGNEMAVREFEEEALLLSRLKHPNIVQVFGSGRNPRQFIIMEHLDGGTLSDRLKRAKEHGGFFKKPAFAFDDLLIYARNLASALDYMHRGCHNGACIIHRDLKPDNVGFTKDGRVKLFDLGLAACVRTRHYSGMAYELTGNTGSLRYMAPEVALGKKYTEAVDVYSFAVLIWQMASEKVPFTGLKRAEFIAQVAEGGLRPPLNHWSWPKSFCSLLESCWFGDPAQRPTFHVVVSELNALIDEVQR